MASSAQHEELRAALERYTKEELVELMEHLLRIYVLNEPVKLDTNVSKPETLRELSGYSFPQLITELQSSLELEELGKFRVTPYTVYVSIGEAEFDMNGPTPELSRGEESEAERESSGPEREEELSPAEKMDAMDNKPWRRVAQPVQAAPSHHAAATPSMADLFAGTNGTDRGYSLFEEVPDRAEKEDDELPPPIADVAPGDDPKVEETPAPADSKDFAKTAANREEKPSAAPSAPPDLAAGDKQINPSNRFASLDLD